MYCSRAIFIEINEKKCRERVSDICLVKLAIPITVGVQVNEISNFSKKTAVCLALGSSIVRNIDRIPAENLDMQTKWNYSMVFQQYQAIL